MADFPPTHPGEVLRTDFLDVYRMTPEGLADAIDLPAAEVAEIVASRRPIGPDAALRLARYFGTSPEFWMGMQATYDLETARDRVGAEIEARVRPRAA